MGAGLGLLLVQEIFQILKRTNEEERGSILLVEQDAPAVLSVAHYGYVMENGRIVLDDIATKLRENEDIKEFIWGAAQLVRQKAIVR